MYNTNNKMLDDLIKLFIFDENSIELFNCYMKNNEVNGYIYCLFNECFLFYGVNVYKIGKAKNIAGRKSDYITPYLDEPKIIIASSPVKNYTVAEQIVFNRLRKYRIKQEREFFDCNIFLIKKTIDDVCILLNKYYNDPTNINLIQNLLIDIPQLLPTYILNNFDVCYDFFKNNYVNTTIKCKNKLEIMLENINDKFIFKNICREAKCVIDNFIIINIDKMHIHVINDENGNIWYRAKHIIQILGYVDYINSLKTNVPKEHRKQLSDLNKNYKSFYKNIQGQTLFIDEIGLNLLLHANHNKSVPEIKERVQKQSKLLCDT